jgi:hypothetical protein
MKEAGKANILQSRSRRIRYTHIQHGISQEAELRTLICLILLAGFVLTGCQPNSTHTGDTPLASPTLTPIPALPTEGEIQMTTAIPSPDDPALQNLIDLTRLDLASRLAVPAEKIMLVEATEVEWSDSSLGCPQPDMGYLQVITPGYRIILDVNGQSHEYHTNKAGYFVYCSGQVPPVLPKQ